MSEESSHETPEGQARVPGDPADTLSSTAPQKAQKPAWRAWALRVSMALVLGALTFGVWKVIPLVKAWQEARNWIPVLRETFESPQSVDKEWNGRPYHFVAPGGGLHLQMDYLIHRLAGLPREPFRLRLRFKQIHEGREARLLVAAVTRLEIFDQVAPQGGIRKWTRWSGLFSAQEFRAGLRLSRVGKAADSIEALLSSQISDMPDSASSHVLKIDYDGDLLSAAVDEDAALTTLVGSPGQGLNAGDGFRIGLSGANIAVESLEFDSRKPAGNVDSVLHADELRLQGLPAEAIRLYESHIKGSSGERRARLLFKKALALDAVGDSEAAHAAYKEILTINSKDEIGSFAAYELAEPQFHLATDLARSDKLAEALDAARQAADWMRPLVETEHPDFKARMLLLRLLSGILNSSSGAESLAREIIATRNDPYAAAALDMLLNQILPPDRAWSKETIEYLAKLGAAGRAGTGSLYDRLLSAKALVLEHMGQGKSYFENMEAIAADSAFSISERDAVFLRADQLSWNAEFRQPMLEWAAAREKAEPLRMAWFCRSFLTARGLRLTRSMGDFSRHSPMAEMAFRFLTSHAEFRQAEAGKEPAEDKLFFKPAAGLANSWGDLNQKAPEITAAGLRFDYDSGNYYGCGLNLFSTEGREACVNMLGFRAMDIKLKVPKGLIWSSSISECGVGSTGSESFAGARGGDGEQFMFEQRRGTGQWETERLLFSDIRPNPQWGNQAGNLILDLQAVLQIDVIVERGQGTGILEIESVTFVR